MADFILDCSVAVAWSFEDESTTEFDALLDRVQHQGAAVPLLWMSEAANVLLMTQRCGRIDSETMQERLALLGTLPIETDATVGGAVWRSSVVTLADVEGADLL